MSILSQQPNPPARRLSGMILILSLALGVCAAAAIILGALYFRQVWGEAPLEQHGTVSPQNKFTGIVYYSIPYGSPPNLKLTSAERQYDIVKQDEKGFTWKVLVRLDDIRDDQRTNGEAIFNVGVRDAESFRNGLLKPDLRFEDFTWQAKGVPVAKDAGGLNVFPQDGTFTVAAGKEGEVDFPIPYAVAPNVELSGQAAASVIIVECHPTGFKWKDASAPIGHPNDWRSVSWKSKGIRATEVPKQNP